MNPVCQSTQSKGAGPRTQLNSEIENEYRMEHAYLKWKIEQFSEFRYANTQDYYFSSPIFKLQEVWWWLKFHPNAKICGVDQISLTLGRSNDLGPIIVKVAYRLGLENHENKIWFDAKENEVFGRGDCKSLQTSVFGHLEDFLADGIANNDDSLFIVCEIYLTYLTSDESKNCRKVINSDLSFDLFNFLKEERDNDTLIVCPTAKFKVHKAILSARCKTFARMFKNNNNEPHVIYLPCSRSCMNCIVIFIYIGSFNFLAKYFCLGIGLYELACELSLHKLSEILVPQEIEIISQIKAQSIRSNWKVLNFRIDEVFLTDIEGSIQRYGDTDLLTKMTLQRLTDNENVYIRIHASILKDSINYQFRFSILNERNQQPEWIPCVLLNSSRVVDGEVCFFEYNVRFSVLDILTCINFDGALDFSMDLDIYTLETRDAIQCVTPLKDSSHNCSWTEDLSSDFLELYRTGYLSDVILEAQCLRTFRVHRCILGARSEYFRNILSDRSFANQVLRVRQMQTNILEIILMFIYSNRAINFTLDGDNNLNKFFVMHVASEVFSIPSLRKHLLVSFYKKLNRNNIQTVLQRAKELKFKHVVIICSIYVQLNLS